MAPQLQTVQELVETPRVYYEVDGPILLNWVAEGADGRLYLAPAVPGGWLQRQPYEGAPQDLRPVSPQKARTLVWFLYGDVGDVPIAGS